MNLQRMILVLGLGSCAAQPVPGGPIATPGAPVLGEVLEDMRAAVPAAAASPLERGLALLRSGDYRRADPWLREELAEGSGFKAAALALASFYRSRENHGEAERILSAALARDPDSLRLNLLHARILAETNRWQEAADALRLAIELHPQSAALHLALVAAERALGRIAEAGSLLDEMLRSFSGDPLVEKSRDDLEVLAEDLAEELRQGRRLTRTANELFAELRAGDGAALRRQAFMTLASKASTRDRAVIVACQQPDPLLRVLAVRAWPIQEEDPEDLIDDVGILFADSDPRVRAAVSGLARSLPPDQAVRLILAAMEREDDAYALRTMHSDLEMVTTTQLRLRPGTAGDPRAREQLVQTWRNIWNR